MAASAGLTFSESGHPWPGKRYIQLAGVVVVVVVVAALGDCAAVMKVILGGGGRGSQTEVYNQPQQQLQTLPRAPDCRLSLPSLRSVVNSVLLAIRHTRHPAPRRSNPGTF